MKERDLLLLEAKQLQSIIEKYTKTPLYGTCYAFSHCLTRILQSKGYTAREVVGSIAVMLRNKSFMSWGDKIAPGENMGDYHSWVEVETEDGITLIDPSLKYDKKAVRKFSGFKVDEAVPDIFISHDHISRTLRYKENEKLRTEINNDIQKLPPDTIEKIIAICVGGVV